MYFPTELHVLRLSEIFLTLFNQKTNSLALFMFHQRRLTVTVYKVSFVNIRLLC